MKKTAALVALMTTCVVASAQYAADAQRRAASAALMKEKQIRDVHWPTAKRLKVGVLDNGRPRDGYAMYVCEVLREHGLGRIGITIHVVDILKLARQNKEVRLGESHCT